MSSVNRWIVNGADWKLSNRSKTNGSFGQGSSLNFFMASSILYLEKRDKTCDSGNSS